MALPCLFPSICESVCLNTMADSDLDCVSWSAARLSILLEATLEAVHDCAWR